MITSRQIRAARGLLNWKQSDLAKSAKISLKAINNMEQELVVPRVNSLLAVRATLEAHAIEFLPNQGVRLKEDELDIQRFDGPASMELLLEDIKKTLTPKGGELLICDVDEHKFYNAGKNHFDAYYKGIHNLNIEEKILIAEGDDFTIAPKEFYRLVPRKNFGLTPHLIYANKFVLVIWGPPIKLIILTNQAVADTFRTKFYSLWNEAKPLSSQM
jgi:transcriptional regulator with XRE-family HTH domain